MARLSSLQKRLISAFVLIPIVLFSILSGGWIFWAFMAVLLSLCLFEWVKISIKTPHKFLSLLLGGLYIAAGIFSSALIVEKLSLYAAFLFLLMVWSADTGAYVFGKLIGGPKMSPYISPKKTWAGFFGACFSAGVLACVAAYAYSQWSGDNGTDALMLNVVFFVGVITAVVGQAGDLLVSFVKRAANVKDSGSLIPGHGGVLDRVDSLLLAAPVFYALYLNVLV